MSAGAVTPQEWADWLQAFRVIHAVVDADLPLHMARDAFLAADLDALPAPRACPAADAFAGSLRTPEQRHGAAYVLHGAHRRGGQVLARVLAGAGLPNGHVVYPVPAEAEAFVKGCRDRADLAEAARATFAALLSTMDEIEARA